MLLIRIGWIQFVRGSELQEEATRIRLRQVKVDAKRGIIYDRNGKELAISISADYVYAIPPEVRRSGRGEETAKKLAEILELPYDKVYQRITKKGSWFEYVKRKVDFNKSEQIKKMDLPGISVAMESQRFYPNSTLAAHVLGFAGIDNQGLEGLEVVYDDVLRGKPGSIDIEFDAAGREIPQAVHRYVPPEDGNNLVLTIDESIQYIAERELDLVMDSTVSPESATIIVMDPRNGEILAMASRPTFDPNNFKDYPASSWRNIAVSNSYEPGSTFKIVTAAAALEEGVVTPEDRFYDKGYIKVGSETIKCWRSYKPHGSQTFVEGVQNSCNPVFVAVGLEIEEKESGLFYDYIRGFGFGEPTGLDVPGEAKGIVIPQKDLKLINIATISIGQGIAVTPIQLIAAMGAIANDGKLMKPHLVKEIRDKEGHVVKSIQPEVIRQVISRETARQMRLILERVVSKGTGRNAYIEGYRVGGKTGTAQKAGKGGYQEGKYVASFLGMAPVNDPRLVALVIIDEPKGYPYYGGTVAAPIFKRVMEDSLRYLGVPPQYDPSVDQPASEEKQQEVVVPDVTNLTPDKAASALREAGLEAVIQGTGPVVRSQIPKGTAKVPRGTQVLLRLGEPGGEEFPLLVSVPDITGKRVAESARILEAFGLYLKAHGNGQVVEQDPIPFTKVPPGTEVKAYFKEIPAVEVLGP